MNSESASLTDNGIAMRGFDILHPIRVRTEHRYEVTFALYGGDHHGVRASAAGCAAINFEHSLGGSPRADHQHIKRFTQRPRRVGRQLR